VSKIFFILKSRILSSPQFPCLFVFPAPVGLTFFSGPLVYPFPSSPSPNFLFHRSHSYCSLNFPHLPLVKPLSYLFPFTFLKFFFSSRKDPSSWKSGTFPQTSSNLVRCDPFKPPLPTPVGGLFPFLSPFTNPRSVGSPPLGIFF